LKIIKNIHIIQSHKIALISSEKAYLFTIESGDGNIARKNRKLQILKEWNKIKNEIMYEIMLSKYKKNRKSRIMAYNISFKRTL
jgi:predicted NAD-dependent protein-ADP-ribosyltransferase YbiA (DUF1768 family)